MPRGLKVEPVDTVPESGQVRHYDELPEAVREQFPGLVMGNEAAERSTDCRPTGAIESCDCEFIKFTEYYRIIR